VEKPVEIVEKSVFSTGICRFSNIPFPEADLYTPLYTPGDFPSLEEIMVPVFTLRYFGFSA